MSMHRERAYHAVLAPGTPAYLLTLTAQHSGAGLHSSCYPPNPLPPPCSVYQIWWDHCPWARESEFWNTLVVNQTLSHGWILRASSSSFSKSKCVSSWGRVIDYEDWENWATIACSKDPNSASLAKHYRFTFYNWKLGNRLLLSKLDPDTPPPLPHWYEVLRVNEPKLASISYRFWYSIWFHKAKGVDWAHTQSLGNSEFGCSISEVNVVQSLIMWQRQIQETQICIENCICRPRPKMFLVV